VYQINFQNDGTSYAKNVTITDTLDSNLPAYEITLNHSSHPYKLSIDGNVLIFRLQNINLLTHTQDQDASKGYVNFTAKLKRDLSAGEIITNKADIYFDYEKPISTNIASIKRIENGDTISSSNIIDILRNKYNKIQVYPNPTNTGVFNIYNSESNPVNVYVYTIEGKEIYRGEMPGNTICLVNLKSTSEGIYILKTNRGETEKIIIR
jgi:hypothetical protein